MRASAHYTNAGRGLPLLALGASCGHVFVTAQGRPRARFKRALASRNPTLAWAAASELDTIDLADALALCLLVADDPPRYSKAAARWHARFCAEVRGVTLAESQLVLAALDALPDAMARSTAAEALAGICEHGGLRGVAATLDDWTRAQ